jgi:hypothetical protein
MNIDEKYENFRQHCLRYANIHPDDPADCAYALERTSRLHPVAVEAASLCDELIAMVRGMEKDKAGLVEALKQIKMVAHDIYQLTGDSDLQMMLDDLRDIADAAIDQREGELSTRHVTPIQEAKDSFIEAYRNWHNSEGAARLDTALAMGLVWKNLQQHGGEQSCEEER